MNQTPPFYTVSALNRFLKRVLDEVPGLQHVNLKGEVSNFKRYPSGHCYFTLKDEEARISAVMFSREAMKLDFPVKDGDEILAYGSVSVYPANGVYQFYVESMSLFGLGKQLLELEKLKKKLTAEGLFDVSRKRPLPSYPKAIGIISGKDSAASRDMIVNITRRYPLTEIYYFPSLVQGDGAPEDLRRALALAQTYPLDTLIIGRGGGANEDLSAFNDEKLVRDVAACRIPTISAVGHEVDVTLCDYAADRRASTPTGAAELATPDGRELAEQLTEDRQRLTTAVNKQLQMLKKTLESLKNRPIFTAPGQMYHERLIEVSHDKDLLSRMMTARLETAKSRYQSLLGRLGALSPSAVLNRGFSYLTDEAGQLINSVQQVSLGQTVKTVLKDGTMMSTVQGKEETNHGQGKN